VLPVPKHLRSASYKGAERLGHTGYQYAHDSADHFVVQEYVPTSATYYEPTRQGYEDVISKRMEAWKRVRDGVTMKPGEEPA
jgi:putative ATPase